jgi:hypothetical protein
MINWGQLRPAWPPTWLFTTVLCLIRLCCHMSASYYILEGLAPLQQVSRRKTFIPQVKGRLPDNGSDQSTFYRTHAGHQPNVFSVSLAGQDYRTACLNSLIIHVQQNLSLTVNTFSTFAFLSASFVKMYDKCCFMHRLGHRTRNNCEVNCSLAHSGADYHQCSKQRTKSSEAMLVVCDGSIE